MNSMKMIRLCDNGDIDTVTICKDDDFTALQDMYTAIGKGCSAIETVPVTPWGFDAVLIADEYGLDSTNAEVNVLASAVSGCKIVGNVLFTAVGMVNGDMDFTGLTDEQITKVMDTLRKIGRNA